MKLPIELKILAKLYEKCIIYYFEEHTISDIINISDKSYIYKKIHILRELEYIDIHNNGILKISLTRKGETLGKLSLEIMKKK